jgi:DNA polymerase-1
VVHCPRADADRVAGVLGEAAEESGRLVFGDTSVRFPLAVAVADCYADAK